MKEKLKPYLLIMPATSILLGIFVAAVIIILIQSLGYFPAVGLDKFTFMYYTKLFTDPTFISSLKFSFYISFVSSTIATILGVLLAYLIVESTHKNFIKNTLYKLPIIVPHSVGVILIYSLLAQSGLVARVLYFFGFISSKSDFPALIYDRNGIGIIIVYLWKSIPFIALTVYTILSNINEKLSQVASNLGARKKDIFWHILLPLSTPTIISSFIIIFAFSFGSFEVPFLLGPTTPKALPVRAYVEYINPDLTNRPYSMVINMTLTIVCVISVLIYEKIFRTIHKR
ncbi:putative spermidine/putrescine transport system permease protein [Alkalithermobacter thermoalcaliphilus JW-YL-7 = DSM 7308]|uniref:ABC-type transporter, integral membrane subunit n=1 Tax=Alkalithermobacter thermoalcaliphilus JW-YL-7 = DSM 7308 TaxID=1121328 RepID=A0A150FQP7_CLOPD|nr:ABC-type transporter, integral membrane subunit [[Clostridium] paradoxum JW-YL-7 = DSM 7308]SHK76816.1 putative spermidine/putrescine transport system permease protein [[Clostridium] paradoxum JW-YL-7 = DSM 7308]